jgi:hypothetical protein
MDDSVVDPSAIVTNHHTSSIKKNTHLDQAPNKYYLSETAVYNSGVATN